MNKQVAMDLIKDVFDSLVRSGTITENVEVKPDTVVLGAQSPLDSIAFVTFVTEFEDRLQSETQKECYLVLSDINNFNINNPSLTADILAEYAVQLTQQS